MAIQPYQRPPQQGAAPQGMPPQMGGAMPQPQPQPQQMAPQQAMPQGGPPSMPPELAAAAGGTAQQQEIAFGKVMQILLLKRIGEMSQEELEALDAIITPESITVLAKLLPELIPVFEHASSLREDGGGIAEEGGENEESDGGNEEEGGSQNPLTEDDSEDEENQMMGRNPAVSRGLVR